MRVAIHAPKFPFKDPAKDFTGFSRAFYLRYRPLLYYPSWRRRLTGAKGLRQLLASRLGVNDVETVHSLRELNRCADVLLCFNDFPAKPENHPPRGFQGMKVWHTMDYVFQASEANRRLCEGGVDWLMGYTDHFKYCPFFRKYYPDWEGKVIPVPFGFGERFQYTRPFAEREAKVSALGSVNPVRDPAVLNQTELAEYCDFYHDVRWTHQWRRTLKENEDKLSGLVHSLLPDFPKTKNFKYDAVEELNRCQMFANDLGLMRFPPARTYEGLACGAVLMGEDHECYRDIGLQDGVNCVMHQPGDIGDFTDKARWWMSQPEKLQALGIAGHELAHNHFTHQAVAERIYHELEIRLNG